MPGAALSRALPPDQGHSLWIHLRVLEQRGGPIRAEDQAPPRMLNIWDLTGQSEQSLGLHAPSLMCHCGPTCYPVPGAWGFPCLPCCMCRGNDLVNLGRQGGSELGSP